MKKGKIIISLLLVVFMLVGVSSIQVTADYDDLAFDTLNEYIEYSIPRHIYAQQIPTSNTLMYSRPVPLYDFSNNSVVA